MKQGRKHFPDFSQLGCFFIDFHQSDKLDSPIRAEQAAGSFVVFFLLVPNTLLGNLLVPIECR